MTKLKQILSYKRPHESDTEREMINKLIKPTGAWRDLEGNWFLQIGLSSVMFSCHTDTVHRQAGYQPVDFDGTLFSLPPEIKTGCLGADDGAGVWMLLKLIEAGIPGLYAFHRGEERGCIGSRFASANHGKLFKDIDYCIAFDRRGTDDLITHQGGRRTCSDAFGLSLIREIGKHSAFKGVNSFKLSELGALTDSKQYIEIIPECTNLGVGYLGNHGPRETLDGAHLHKLLEAFKQVDFEAVEVSRIPGSHEWKNYGTVKKNVVVTKNKGETKEERKIRLWKTIKIWDPAHGEWQNGPEWDRFRAQQIRDGLTPTPDRELTKAFKVLPKAEGQALEPKKSVWDPTPFPNAQQIAAKGNTRDGIISTQTVPYNGSFPYSCNANDPFNDPYIGHLDNIYGKKKVESILSGTIKNLNEEVKKAICPVFTKINRGENMVLPFDNANPLIRPLSEHEKRVNTKLKKDGFSPMSSKEFNELTGDNVVWEEEIEAFFHTNMEVKDFQELAKLAQITLDYPGEVAYILQGWGYNEKSFLSEFNDKFPDYEDIA